MPASIKNIFIEFDAIKKTNRKENRKRKT